MKTVQIIALFLFFGAFSARVSAQTPAQNKASLLKAYDYFNVKNFDGFSTLLADNFVEYAAPQPVNGKMAAVETVKGYMNAFPDFHITVQKVVAEGNTVMALITTTGTWKNEMMGMAPTGKAFKVMDVDIVEFDATGKATAHWAVQDPMVMMSQISK